MKSKKINKIIVILCLIITILNLFGTTIHSFFYSMDDLPKGDFLFSAMSNDTKKTLKIYRVEVINLGTGIRGELITNEDGKEIKRNIYWQINKENAIVSWVNSETVMINGEKININEEGYDCRSKITIPETPAKNKGLI